MTRQLDRTFESMIGALKQNILPELRDDFARGQAFGVIYMLEQFRLQLDWSIAPLLAKLEHQRAARIALRDMFEGLDAPPWPHEDVDARHALSGSELQALCEEGNRWLDSVLEWLEQSRPALSLELSARIEDVARACARAVNNIDSDLTTSPMFDQISTGQNPGASPTNSGTRAR